MAVMHPGEFAVLGDEPQALSADSFVVLPSLFGPTGQSDQLAQHES